jgi:hypothetical protein
VGIVIRDSLLSLDKEHTDSRGENIQAVDGQGEEHEGYLFVGLESCVLSELGTQDHSTEDFSSYTLEQVSSLSGTVTNVITNEVGNNGRVSRIIFGDTSFDFS